MLTAPPLLSSTYSSTQQQISAISNGQSNDNLDLVDQWYFYVIARSASDAVHRTTSIHVPPPLASRARSQCVVFIYYDHDQVVVNLKAAQQQRPTPI